MANGDEVLHLKANPTSIKLGLLVFLNLKAVLY